MRTLILAVLLAALPQDDLKKEIEILCGRLSSDSIEERDLAVRDLVKIGRPAIPAVEALLADRDSEVRQRSEGILRSIRFTLRSGALRLHVTASNEKVRPGDEIRIDVEVENIEDFPVVFCRDLPDLASPLRVEIRSGSDLVQPFWEIGPQRMMPEEIVITEQSFITVKPRGRVSVARLAFDRHGSKMPRLKGDESKVDPLPAGIITVKATCALSRADLARREAALLKDWCPIRVVFKDQARAFLDQAWEGSLTAGTTFEVLEK